jgi:hypothetical protein
MTDPDPPIYYFITKYAVTDGQIDVMPLRADEHFPTRCYTVKGYGYTQAFTLGKECFLTKAEAVKNFDLRRERAIQTAQRKIDKLKKMTNPKFKDIPPDEPVEKVIVDLETAFGALAFHPVRTKP